jgi:hypothetical protein
MVVEDNGGPGAVGAEQRSAFVDQVSDGLGRADQRRTARVYLRGLLDPQGGRGSPAAKSGVEHAASRALQQFITFLPWEWQPPRPRIAELTRRSVPSGRWRRPWLCQRCAPAARRIGCCSCR